MTRRLFPSTDAVVNQPFDGNPNGSRVFRVTDRTIHARTRLILAHDAESAVAENASAISYLGQETIHEVTECIELVPGDQVYRVPPEKVKA